MQVLYCFCGFYLCFVVYLFSDATSIVKYGTNPYDWTTVTSNVTKTYTAKDMCAPPANGPSFVDPGFIHDVLLRNLTPGIIYYYTYGSETVCLSMTLQYLKLVSPF